MIFHKREIITMENAAMECSNNFPHEHLRGARLENITERLVSLGIIVANWGTN